jgi:hypothetical protein
MSKIFKIGIPVLIAVLMLVIGTGLVLAKQNDTPVLTGPTASYDGYLGGTWEGCWNNGYCSGPGVGYGPGSWSRNNPANYPPCHGYWR